jgi:hypothetical protein
VKVVGEIGCRLKRASDDALKSIGRRIFVGMERVLDVCGTT